MSRTLEDHLFAKGKKRVLAIDGGGARGILACGILKRVETLLKSRLPYEQRENFRLHQYFDLIGGTSTGSILAAGLAIGLSVDDVRKLYLNLCPEIFVERGNGHQSPKFKAQILADELARVLREADGKALPLRFGRRAQAEPEVGEPIKLGSSALKTGFAVFAKRINTGGSWALTNNPHWRYFDEASHRAYCERMGLTYYPSKDNKDFALAQLVQASAAAPTYFASVGIGADVASDGSQGVTVEEVSKVAPPDGVFVDGALSGRNTPAMQMLFMVRHPAFGFNWETAHRRPDGEIEEDLLMISVGTGWWRPRLDDQILKLMNVSRLVPEAMRAIMTLQTMIHDSQLNALQWLQSMSRHPLEKHKRWTIDGEVDDLTLEKGTPFLATTEPQLRFRRLDVRLEDAAMKALFGHDLATEARGLGLAPKTPGAMRRRLERAGRAWGKPATESKPAVPESAAVMRTRELAEFDKDALNLLFEIGSKYAESAVDDDDFPKEFDPPHINKSDASDTVAVIEEPTPPQRKSIFGGG